MASKSQRDKRRNDRLALLCEANPQLLCESNPQPFALECDTAVEFVAAAGDKKLPSFSMTAYTGGRMLPRGFSIPVVADLMSLKIMAGPRPIFMNHDPNRIVGHATVKVEGRSIKVVDGVISGAGPAAEEVRASSANGFPWKASIGGNPERMEFVEATKQVEVNGQKFNGPLYVARGVSIHEVSFVPLAGDNRTSATVAASFNTGDSPMTFEAWLQANGFDIATLNDTQKKKLQAAFDAEMKLAAGTAGGGNPTPPNGNGTPSSNPAPIAASGNTGPIVPQNPVADFRAEMAAETARVKAINAMFATNPLYANVKVKTSTGEFDLQAHALAEGWTPEATELLALRSSRPAPAIHSQSHDVDCNLQALQGALMLRAGLTLDSKHWGTPQAVALSIPGWLRAGLNNDNRQRVMEASHRYSSTSFYDLCREAVRIDGKDISADRQAVIQAAFSGSTLTSIFTTSVNAKMLATYMESPDTTRGWTSETDVANFMTQDRIQLAKGGALEKLPRGQTASHTTRSDKAESYKIARYAKQFVLDEQDVIDDRLNALQDIPKEMGLAAARLRPDLVYAILFANAALADGITLFHSSHSNTDTSAALAADKLKTGITKIGLQTDNGVNLSLEATHLIVPKTLEFTGKELMNSSLVVVTGSTDLVRGDANVLKSALQVVADSRLDNGVTDPSSGTAYSGDTNDWFVAAAAANTIEVGYRVGTGRVPTVRSFTLDRGQYGMGWDVCMDIGAKALDFKGLYRGQG
jgi:hypothetical protein